MEIIRGFEPRDPGSTPGRTIILLWGHGVTRLSHSAPDRLMGVQISLSSLSFYSILIHIILVSIFSTLYTEEIIKKDWNVNLFSFTIFFVEQSLWVF